MDKQYETTSELNVRVEFHKRFSTSIIPWNNWVYENLNLSNNSKILEIGCGTGKLWSENKDKLSSDLKIYLTDYSKAMVEETKLKTKSISQIIEVTQMSGEKLEFLDSTFDFVIVNHVMHLFEDKDKCLKEIKRVLKPKGFLCSTTFSKNNMKYLSDLYNEFSNSDKLRLVSKDFTLENGKEQLKKYFPDVKVFEYKDEICISEFSWISKYLISIGVDKLKDTIYEKSFIDFLSKKADKKGKIYIDKKSGIFIARKEDRKRRVIL